MSADPAAAAAHHDAPQSLDDGRGPGVLVVNQGVEVPLGGEEMGGEDRRLGGQMSIMRVSKGGARQLFAASLALTHINNTHVRPSTTHLMSSARTCVPSATTRAAVVNVVVPSSPLALMSSKRAASPCVVD
jgi:hypothetical protein